VGQMGRYRWQFESSVISYPSLKDGTRIEQPNLIFATVNRDTIFLSCAANVWLNHLLNFVDTQKHSNPTIQPSQVSADCAVGF